MKKSIGSFCTLCLIAVLTTWCVSHGKKRNFQVQYSNNSVLIENIGVEKDVHSKNNQVEKTVEFRIRGAEADDTNDISP
jgi:hypothetical protein